MDIHWLFLLGKTPDLGYAELAVVLSRLDIHSPLKRLTPHLVSLKASLDPHSLIGQLGGTVKIANAIVTVEKNEVASNLASTIFESKDTSFIVTDFSGKYTDSLAVDIKDSVKSMGLITRFKYPKNPWSSAGVTQKWQEYLIVPANNNLILAKTVAVQDLDKWTAIDYDRPRSDPRSGMLPPKVALMMLNLAFTQPLSRNTVIYDPFCGSGTILLVGLSQGVSVVGSDISPKAVDATKINCQWFNNKFQPEGEFNVFLKDAVQVSGADVNGQVSAIVFEGFLGPPNLPPNKIADYHKGLGKLYLGAIKRFSSLLPKGGRIVCALPQFITPNGVKNYDNLIDSCEKYGYTVSTERYVYGRKEAFIKRSIYILQKN